MIVVDCEQGSREWEECRMGIPTASSFARIVTNSGKLSDSRDKYLGELLAEYCTGDPYQPFKGNEWVDRGKALEDKARMRYAFQRDLEVRKVGFVYMDEDRMIGCSPDGLVGNDGGLELKCPKAPNHLVWLSRDKIPKEHRPQVQASLWITGLAWWDFMSYHPGLPPFIKREYPDPQYHKDLDKHMPGFVEEVLKARERMKKIGAVINSDS